MSGGDLGSSWIHSMATLHWGDCGGGTGSGSLAVGGLQSSKARSNLSAALLWVAITSSARMWLVVNALWRRFFATCEVLLKLLWDPCSVGGLPQGCSASHERRHTYQGVTRMTLS